MGDQVSVRSGSDTGSLKRNAINNAKEDSPTSSPDPETEVSPRDLEDLILGVSVNAKEEGPANPFDVDNPNWSFRKALSAAIERSGGGDANPISPHVSLVWKDLEVYGVDLGIKTQTDATSFLWKLFLFPTHSWRREQEKRILYGIDGFLYPGEMLLVLGGPGSGCTTLLKLLAGRTEGYRRWTGHIDYSGIPIDAMQRQFRGSIVYNGEVDCHFPYLTVAQTLDFAASTKTPHCRITSITRGEYIETARAIVGATFGLGHTFNTRLGNDFVRGVSGGERRRVSIAEMLLTRASVTCWDNPTRGLDSSTSLDFAQALRAATDLTNNISVSALYQPGDTLAGIYDKVILLHRGHQIWFGTLASAKGHFESMGFSCGPRQTIAEFLVSVTDPNAAVIKPGFEVRVPRTPGEFEARWKSSAQYKRLREELHCREGHISSTYTDSMQRFKAMRVREKAPITRTKSPYTLNMAMQFSATFKRACQRLKGEYAYYLAVTITMISVSLLIGSMFYNIPPDTSGYFSKGNAIFFIVLFNIIINFAEVSAQFSQRAIVEKQHSYAMYHPYVDALATMISQYPIKMLNIIIFSSIVYFMANLKREAGAFFIFVLFTFVSTSTMTALFRSIASLVASVETALALSGLIILPLAIYGGAIIPRPSMHPWFKWISYMNPIYYAVEALMAVEFHDQRAPCKNLVPSGPGYENVDLSYKVCPMVGSHPGQTYVLGDDYAELSFGYRYSHVWRNFAICIGFFLLFTITYAVATEFKRLSSASSNSMIFHKTNSIFRRTNSDDLEESPIEFEVMNDSRSSAPDIRNHADVFCWENISYSIDVKGENVQLLKDIQGFVEPGTLTALLGESGAGKTTLLNVLAQRVDIGIVSGEATISGHPVGASLQRRVGYVQQQDVHLAEATVREALRFSAELRQPKDVPIAEKHDYVETIMSALGLTDFAEAVIGVPGKGLNAEKRKRVTIGLELVAKPTLLLFVDEPTSGLDSQSAWAIIKLLRDLANGGQAILCTIHQPSATIFEQFDRLLLLTKGGRTVYFGDLGKDCQTLLEYFERNSAPKCNRNSNPAEYLLSLTGAGAKAHTDIDWVETWSKSPEYAQLLSRIQLLKSRDGQTQTADTTSAFAQNWLSQYSLVQKRLFQQHWRSPSYVYGKIFINVVGGLFLGFTFYKEDQSIQGLQNKMFSIFMVLLLCLVLIILLQPRLISLRDIYEVRERYAKMYHWTVFVAANIVVEIPFNIFISSLCFLCWYFPVGWWKYISNGGGTYMWLVFTVYQVYHASFSQAIAVLLPNAETAGMVTILFYTFILAFNGVLQPLSQLVSFWHFAYYISPYTYLAASLMSAGVHNVSVRCSKAEINIFQPPPGMTCFEYAGLFANATLATIYNPEATKDCQFCRYAVSDSYLESFNMFYRDRWRNFGLLIVYTVLNICVFFLGFYLRSHSNIRAHFARVRGKFQRK